MEFRIEILDYGRFGVVAKEPRTGLCAEGVTREEVRQRITDLLREHLVVSQGYIPPDDGPVRTIETIVI